MGTMEIAYDDMPDDTWRRAGEVLMDAWRPALENRSARAVVRPLRAPDGAIEPYLLEVKTTTADGNPDFNGAALVWDGALLNKGGAAAATRWLAALGFPAKHMGVGHLVQGLFVTNTVPSGWLRPPLLHGWSELEGVDDRFKAPQASVRYGKDGTATLTLYRQGSLGSGGGSLGGYTPSPVERLEVRFAKNAAITMDAARKTATGKDWESINL